jgi:phospholipase/carboxylesterase
VVLALHGTGADEHDLLGLVATLSPGSPVISPRGRVSEHGMNRWFRRMGEGVFDVEDVIARAAELAGFVTDALAHYDLKGRPLVAVGFSNGANIATATALLHPEVLDTVLAFSGMYPFADQDPMEDVSGVRLFLANGESDPMAPGVSVERLDTIATQHRATVTRLTRPGGHGITEDEVAQAVSWLSPREA